MSTLSIQQLSKCFNQQCVIQPMQVEIASGELIVVVGPSGCGKSTLLRMIAGLETPSSGQIFLNNKPITQLQPKMRDIAMVFQNYALYPHMTVFENMAYGLKIRRTPRSEIIERTEKVAAVLELQHLLHRKPSELSGGQRQRVAMGRAMVREPALFLFDEPLSNLDAKLRVSMRMRIKQLQQRLNTTSIYVTHDQVEAMTLADRIIVLNHGVIEQFGKPLEIYHQPASQFVAGFLGSPTMNFFPAGLVGEDVRYNLGIRPEHVNLCAIDSARLIGEVAYIEALGADNLAYIDIHGHSEPICVRHKPNSGLQPGEEVGLLFDNQHCHWFDVKTQLRVSHL